MNDDCKYNEGVQCLKRRGCWACGWNPNIPKWELVERRRRAAENALPVTPRNVVSNAERKEFRRLYDLGLSDVEIAKKTGRSDSAVNHWRKTEGLAPIGRTGPKITIDYKFMRKLYDEGKTDHEISKELKCHKSSVTLWRRKEKLPFNTSGTKGNT